MVGLARDLVFAGMLLGPDQDCFRRRIRTGRAVAAQRRDQNLAGNTAEYRVFLPFVDHSQTSRQLRR